MYSNRPLSQEAHCRCRSLRINADADEWGREALATLEHALPADVRSKARHKALVVTGRTSETILRIAREEHVGLIVMGGHSRGTIDRLLRIHDAGSDSSSPPLGDSATGSSRRRRE